MSEEIDPGARDVGTTTGGGGIGTGLLVALALLSAAGPLGTDMYLPTFVQLTADLHTTASTTQLTLTAFLIGMGLGQLLVGPVSDARGRRPVLIVGAAAFLASSVTAALVSSVWALIAVRLVMGAAGGVGVVCSRAVISDRESGRAAARAFSLMMAIQGVCPILAPVLGGLLGPAIGWRGIFVVLSVFNLAMLVAAIVVVPETLPAHARSGGGMRALWRGIVTACRRRAFVGLTAVFAATFGVLFSYISASPYVLEGQFGLSSGLYAVVFACNSGLIAVASMVNMRLVERFSPRRILLLSLVVMVAAAAVLLASALLRPSLAVVLPMLAVVVTCFGLASGNATALGAEEVRDVAGAGSGVMGATQFAMAGLVSPLVGIGADHAVSMGIVMVSCASVALILLVTVARAPRPLR